MLTSSSFSLGEMLQMIMPTIIALFLHVPFFETPGHRFDPTALVFSGIVLGFLVSDAAITVSAYAVMLVPVFRERLVERRRYRRWAEGNWRLGRLRQRETEDERESVDVNVNYALFTQVVCCYLMIYLLATAGYAAYALTHAEPSAAAAGKWAGAFVTARAVPTGDAWLWRLVWGLKTPVFGGWLARTVVVASATLVTLAFLLRDYLSKYRQVFGPGGTRERLAEKYQKEKGDLAVGVWGRVTEKRPADVTAVVVPVIDLTLREKKTEEVKPVAKLKLRLLKGGAQVGGEVETNEDGYYRFENAFEQCKGAVVTIELVEKTLVKRVYNAMKAKYESKTSYVIVKSPEPLNIDLTTGKEIPSKDILVELSDKEADATTTTSDEPDEPAPQPEVVVVTQPREGAATAYRFLARLAPLQAVKDAWARRSRRDGAGSNGGAQADGK